MPTEDVKCNLLLTCEYPNVSTVTSDKNILIKQQDVITGMSNIVQQYSLSFSASYFVY